MYLTNKLTEDIEQFQLKMLSPAEEPLPDPSKFSDDAMKTLTHWASMLAAGNFPNLEKAGCYVAWGMDTSTWNNVDPDAFTLASDGAGNAWLLCSDGYVRSWCHDEGGAMEDFNEFESIDSFIECHVLATAVMSELVPLETIEDRFKNHEDEGWEWMEENLEEFVEDL